MNVVIGQVAEKY